MEIHQNHKMNIHKQYKKDQTKKMLRYINDPLV